MSEYLPTADLSPSLYDDALMTILPRHAAHLYGGSKRFEFRKTIPRVVPRRIFLYETAGVAAITGHIVVEEVLSGSPDYIWSLTGVAGSRRASFDAYFEGRELGYAFRVGAAVKYVQPLSKETISKVERGFRVPQNFLYLQNLPRLRSMLARLAIETKSDLWQWSFETSTDRGE